MIRVYKRVEDEGRLITFATATNEDLSGVPDVSLARIPDHCMFNVAELEKHDWHAPHWDSPATIDVVLARSFEARDEYVERIKNAILDALAGRAPVFPCKDKSEREKQRREMWKQAKKLEEIGYKLLLEVSR